MAFVMDFALTALFAIAIWWAATGLILYLDGLPRHTFRWSLLAAAMLAAAALVATAMVRDIATPAGAVAGFLAAIALWGFNEMAFLMGYVTGSRTAPCPPGCTGWQRFCYAFAALVHHELALVASLAVLGVLCLGAANAMAFWTFALLWAMRLSAKLNIFLGVSNVTEEFMPERIAYLKSYFRNAPMNPLFPFSVTAATVTTYVLGAQAFDPGATAFAAMAATLLATFAALAVLEHWLLVVPLRAAAMWEWGLSSHQATRTNAAREGCGSKPASEHATAGTNFEARMTPMTSRS